MENQTPPAQAQPRRAIVPNLLSYHGTTGGIYGIWIKNFFLNVVTLRLYNYWAKTNMRKYLIGALELGGDRFEYHGTGKELMKGALKIVPIYFIFVIGLLVYMQQAGISQDKQGMVFMLLFPGFVYIIAIAQYSGFRYRVNRISWRGIRARMGGSAVAYGGYYMKGALIQFFTLGLMSPSVDLGRFAYKFNAINYGTATFKSESDPARLRGVNIATLLLLLPTLGLSRLWYHAALQRECMRGLTLGHLRFRSTLHGGDFLLFFLGNIAILIFTLGLGYPLILARQTQLYSRFIAVGGDLSTLSTAQIEQGGAGDAEALQSFFDLDIGFIGT